MLRIKDITLKGVKSYRNEAKIDFYEGTSVIIGPNGAGKTTLLEAIRYGLFGGFMDQNQDIIDFMRDDSDFYIEMLFEANGEQYLVKRGCKLSGKKNRPTYDHELILPDGETLNTKTSIDKKIKQDILSLSASVMDTASFVEQGSLANIITLKGAKLRDEFSKILQLERFIDLKSVWYTMAYRINREIGKEQEDIEEEEKKLEEIPELQEKANQLEEEIKELHSKFSELDKSYLEIKQIADEEESYRKKYEEFQTEIKEKSEQFTQANQKIEELKEQLEQIPSEDISENSTNLLQKEINELETREIHLRKFETKVLEEAGSLPNLTNQKKEIQEKLDELKTKMMNKKQQLPQDLVPTKERLDEQKNMVSKNIDALSEKQTNLSHAVGLLGELNDKKSNLKEIESTIKQIETKLEPFYSIDVEELENIDFQKISKVQPLIQNISDKIDVLEERREELMEELNQNKKNLSLLENEIETKEHIINDLRDKGEHECQTCYSIITEDKLEDTIKRMEEFIKINSKLLNNLNEETQFKETKLESILEQLNPYKQFINLHKKNDLVYLVDQYQSEIDAYKNGKTKLEEFRSEHNLEDVQLDTISEELTNTKTRIDALSDYLQSINKIQENEQNLEKINEKLDNVYDKLDQLYEEFEIEKDKNQKTIQRDIDVLVTKKKQLIRDREKIIEIINKEKLNDQLRNRVNDLEKEINSLEDKLLDDRFENISDKLTEIINERNSIDSKKEDKRKVKAETVAEINSLKEAEQALQERKTKLEIKTKVKQTASELSTIFENIHPEILNQKTKNIEYNANQMLRKMPSDSGIFQLKIDDIGKKNATINVSRGSGLPELSTYTLSGGEKMSAAFAIRVAMSKELADIGFMVLDEPTDGLDEERRRLLAEIISTQQHVKQLLVVTHDESFNGITDNIISVRQTGGSSRLTKGTFTDEELDALLVD